MKTKTAWGLVMLATLATAFGGCGHGRSLVAEARAAEAQPAIVEIPFNTDIVGRLDRSLCTDTNLVGDAFDLTTLADVFSGGRVVLAAGTVITGQLCDVRAAGRAHCPAQMTLSFRQLTDAGGCMRALTAEAIALRAAGAGGAVATGADVAIGPGIGEGSVVVLARQGSDVTLAAGRKVSVRLTSPVRVEPPARR